MLLEGLPHARGGVSAANGLLAIGGASSPRPWGCFFSFAQLFPPAGVFPTPVGVFLRSYLHFDASRSLPHARGGVSPPAKTGRPLFCSCSQPIGSLYSHIVIPQDKRTSSTALRISFNSLPQSR